MKKLILLFFVMNPFVHATDQLEKRSLLVQTYMHNQEELWKITKSVPPDFYISILGLNFPESNQVEQKAKSTILFLAANTALLEAKEDLLNIINCKKTFDKYKAIAQAWSTPEGMIKNCPPTNDKIADGVCANISLQCRASFLEFELHYGRMILLNQKFTRSKFEMNELANVSEMTSIYWLNALIDNVKMNCSLGDGPKALVLDFSNACKELRARQINDSVISQEFNSMHVWKKTIENGCRDTSPYTRAPLYFAGDGATGRNGTYCRGNHFIGILNPKQEILLVNSRTRAFYWLEMAEYFFELSKVNQIIEKDVKVLKLEGLFKNFSSDGLSFSTKFKEAIKGKNHLNQLNLFYSDFILIGAAYNSNQTLGTSEKTAIRRLAQDLNASREMALNLKRDIQDLLIKGHFYFDFNLDHF